MIAHATTIALRHGGGWRGVMLQGPSGIGKSDLALRALAAGWRLVADDRTVIWTSGERLFGKPPPILAGLVEARGQGVLSAPALPFVELALVVGCIGSAADLERIPEAQTAQLLHMSLPYVRLCVREASAVARLVRLAESGRCPRPCFDSVAQERI